MAKWYKNLTIDDLINAGITKVDPDGKYIIKNGKKITKFTKTRSGYKGKYYLSFNIYDLDEFGDKIKIPVVRKIKDPKGNIKIYNTWSYKNRTIGLHRAVYLFNRFLEDSTFQEIPAGYDVDHIINDPTNNSYNNLQLIDRETNLAKDRPEAIYRAKMSKKYTEEYILSKINFHEARIAKLRAQKNDLNRKLVDEQIHKVRSSVAQWKNRLKQFLKEI